MIANSLCCPAACSVSVSQPCTPRSTRVRRVVRRTRVAPVYIARRACRASYTQRPSTRHDNSRLKRWHETRWRITTRSRCRRRCCHTHRIERPLSNKTRWSPGSLWEALDNRGCRQFGAVGRIVIELHLLRDRLLQPARLAAWSGEMLAWTPYVWSVPAELTIESLIQVVFLCIRSE